MGRAFTWAAAALMALTAWMSAAPARASTFSDGRLLSICVAPVQNGQRFDDLIAGRIPLDCEGKQTRYGGGDFWASTQGPLSIAAGDEALRLRMASLWQARVTIGVVHAGGHVDWLSADSRQLSRHVRAGATIEFAIPARASPIERIVWRVDGSANRRGILNGVHLMTERESDAAALRMLTLYAAFGGLAIALLIYNFALWGALRHRFQLAYCGMLAMLLLYALSTSGVLSWLAPGIDNNNRLRINYLTLATSAAAALLFARSYFEPRIFARGLGRLIDAVIGMLVAVGIGVALFAHLWMALLDTLYSIACVSLIALVPLIVWRGYVERSRYLWMFALAWTAPIVMAATRILQSFNLLDWNFWLDNSTLIAMAIEALLSSLAIAYRIRLLSAERDKAIAEAAVERLLAATDPLTGLLNRRAFLAGAIGRPGAQQVVLLDIDHFKRVNETLGHDGGDEVLRRVARTLRQSVPADTLVARLGGEEFALVAHAATPIDPGRLLASLRAARMPCDLTITASIGACVGSLGSDGDWTRLYKCADQALYEAKAAGRDRARIACGLAAVA